jgi:hypothetical protein
MPFLLITDTSPPSLAGRYPKVCSRVDIVFKSGLTPLASPVHRSAKVVYFDDPPSDKLSNLGHNIFVPKFIASTLGITNDDQVEVLFVTHHGTLINDSFTKGESRYHRVVLDAKVSDVYLEILIPIIVLDGIATRVTADYVTNVSDKPHRSVIVYKVYNETLCWTLKEVMEDSIT